MSYPAFSSRPPAGGSGHRYSAKNNVRPRNFACFAPKARRVAIVGDFNHWDAGANPMQRQPDGAWTIQLQLTHGPHHYLFMVDDEYQLDPRAQGAVATEEGGRVSLVTVS